MDRRTARILSNFGRFMTDTTNDVAALRTKVTKLDGDVNALIELVGTLKASVSTLKDQLVAAQAQGFTVPQDVLDTVDGDIAKAEAALVDSVTVSDTNATPPASNG
jgi:hypothetical protein